MMNKLKLILILSQVFTLTFTCQAIIASLKFENSKISLNFEQTSTGINFFVSRGDNVLQTASLDSTFAKSRVVRSGKKITLIAENDEQTQFEIVEDSPNFSMIQITRKVTKGKTSEDCFDLNIGSVNWYGGPENRYQYWPIEKASFTDYSYVTKETDNCALTERYWINSRGVFIYIEEETPLFIDQNSEKHPNKICFSSDQRLPYNERSETNTFNYRIGVGSDARVAHLKAVQTILGKPSGFPDERMVRHPIWSTWALYKTNIDEQIVTEFANKILANNFQNGQLEIDDDWEECYGALTFNANKFPNIKAYTDELKRKGFRITLWIHPFINKNCEKWYNEAKEKKYLVLDHEGNPDTQWWNSGKSEAAYIDFTKPDAANWFTERLKKLQTEAGIDSFKFDAGESSWTPPDPVLNGALEKHPSAITSDYVRTVAKFGDMVEVRSGQNTQDLPIFLRMIDKDSEWGWNNGLQTLVTTLLQMNMVGYPLVLPDMIGGNGYENKPPNKEMFIRWLQANTFMPSLQFSFVPWQYDQETVDISLKFTKLHDEYTNEILNRFKLASTNGDPVNPPLWWIAPNDVVAHQITDQFLLGENIIVAPVLVQGQTKRDIYLPEGRWQDGNTDKIYIGPKWLMHYDAPIDILPYFIAKPE